MEDVVYTTAGGRRFHTDPDCRALESAQALNGDGSSYAGYGVVIGQYPPIPVTVCEAARAGFTACRVCVPPAHALPATGRTYGHEPVTEAAYYGPEVVCARCHMPWLPMLSQPWPCRSAVVLGLVPRGGEA